MANSNTLTQIDALKVEARKAYFEKRYWTEKLEELDLQIKILENGNKS